MTQQSVDTRRYVVLVLDDEASGVAAMIHRARTEHQMAADVVPCRSADEVCARLGSGRRFSAVMASLDHPGRDCELIDAAARASTPVISVGRSDTWRSAGPPGVAARVDARSPAALARAIDAVGVPVLLADRPPDLGWPSSGPSWRARLVAVCGAGGAGTSTVAAALAAGLAAGAADGAAGPDVLLADLALRSEQLLLHGLAGPGRAGPDRSIGLLDLIRCYARHRNGMTGSQLRAHTLAVGGFRLLPGLRRPAHWTAVSPVVFDLALGGLCSTFELVVADVTAELEGERQVGSIDVEERNHMARRAVTWADVVVVIARPGRAGARRLEATVSDVLDLGVDPARVQPVVNRVTRPTAARDQLTGCPGPVLALPERFLDDKGGPVPPDLAEPVRAGVLSLLGQLSPPDRAHAPVLLTPGSLGAASALGPA